MLVLLRRLLLNLQKCKTSTWAQCNICRVELWVYSLAGKRSLLCFRRIRENHLQTLCTSQSLHLMQPSNARQERPSAQEYSSHGQKCALTATLTRCLPYGLRISIPYPTHIIARTILSIICCLAVCQGLQSKLGTTGT